MGEIIITGDVFKSSTFYFKMDLTCTRIDFFLYSKAANKFTFFPQFSNGAKTMDHLESRIYTGNLKEATRTAKIFRYVFNKCTVSSPICFHLNRMGSGNDGISSEEHFENSKTRSIYY
jgi:hypothetical protein